MAFEDHFSGHAEAYARQRPTYPKELFSFLAGLTPEPSHAWDCATGSGQAALELSNHFQRVTATDASAEQIANATPAQRVTYQVAPAEQTEIENESIDLITVAQALHWFDFDRFYQECRRVLKPNGVVAAWSYALTSVNSEIDAIISDFYTGEIDPFWPAGRDHVENKYRDIPFPFEPINAPEFSMALPWQADHMLAYLRTWSSVQRFIAEHGRDPVDQIEGPLREIWQDQTRQVSWPLTLLIGRR